MALPLRILAWVVAVGLGGLVIRSFARMTGWLTGDSLIDLITGSGVLRYVRIFMLVPFWALVAAGLATLFIEGGRWLARRRDLAAGRRPRPVRPAAKRPAPTRKSPPPRAPGPSEPVGAAPPPPVRRAVPKPAVPKPAAPEPATAETRSPSGAAAAPKPRRIPRRDVTP